MHVIPPACASALSFNSCPGRRIWNTAGKVISGAAIYWPGFQHSRAAEIIYCGSHVQTADRPAACAPRHFAKRFRFFLLLIAQFPCRFVTFIQLFCSQFVSLVRLFWNKKQLPLLSGADVWDARHCCQCCQQAGWSWYQFWSSKLPDTETIPCQNKKALYSAKISLLLSSGAFS